MRQLFLFIIAISLLSSCEENCEVNDKSLLYHTYTGRIGVTNNSSLLSFDDRILICGNLHAESFVYKIEKTGELVWRTNCDTIPGTLLTGIAEKMVDSSCQDM